MPPLSLAETEVPETTLRDGLVDKGQVHPESLGNIRRR